MGSFGEVTEFGHGFKSHFLFDPKYTNLNHGMLYCTPLPKSGDTSPSKISACQRAPGFCMVMIVQTIEVAVN